VGFVAVELADGRVGFVSATDVIRKNYDPTEPNIFLNATILSDNLLGANAYINQNGRYVRIDAVIKNGTRVHLVEKFNPNSDYTEIIIYDDYGQLRCFVETRYVDYDSSSILQVTALIIAAVAVLLAAGLYMFHRRTKRGK
jgi:hypothetical protein